MICQDCFKFHLFFSISSLSLTLTLNAFEPFLSVIGAKNLGMNVFFLRAGAQAKWIGLRWPSVRPIFRAQVKFSCDCVKAYGLGLGLCLLHVDLENSQREAEVTE